MVDRLEELLALLEEEAGEEQEDGPALELGAEVPAPPAPAVESGKSAEDGEREMGPVLEKDAPARTGGLERRPEAKAAVLERRRDEELEAGGMEADTVGAEAVGNETAELSWDGLTAAVMGPNGSKVLRRPGNGDVEIEEPVGAAGKMAAAEALGAVADAAASAERGLEGLYRQTAQAGRPAERRFPAEQGGRSVRAEEPGRTAALTVEELDRAVRRDSRRYDGGMTLF